MILVEKTRIGSGITLKGDFFDLDRLYFAIFKFTGFHGTDSKCTFPGYETACENLLGLCYEIRHAWQGDRNIEQVYNGVHDEWFDDYHDDEVQVDTFINKFSRKDYPDVTKSNTYFSIPLGFPESIFYSLILLELLKKKDIFIEARKQMAQELDTSTDLNKQYYLFQAHEDIARITLFTNHALHTLFRFIGEDKYTAFMDKFRSYNAFFLTCDLEYLNNILTDYDESNHGNDDPDALFNILMLFFK